jgi:DnaJ-class molecular chaperone
MTYKHVTCWLCHGRGSVAYDIRGPGDTVIERDQRCSVCAGKCTIVVETESEET